MNIDYADDDNKGKMVAVVGAVITTVTSSTFLLPIKKKNKKIKQNKQKNLKKNIRLFYSISKSHINSYD